MSRDVLPRRAAILVFLAFATAYFLSTLLRAITATLSPTLSLEFDLQASDLGLLAGGYFFGFSLTQLPMGYWLDCYGPKKVILSFLGVAVVGCVAFALAQDFSALLLARVLMGVGVSACLMAPLTGYRRWLSPAHLQRANAWMLMVGALGMLTSTLPVQWLLPVLGWRWMFAALGLLVVLSMALMLWQVPPWRLVPSEALPDAPAPMGYRDIWRNPYFRCVVPLGFFNYGGMTAMQTLWAGPWMVKVAGYTPLQAATGLFWLNVSMLLTFWFWGWVTPALTQRGWDTNRLMSYGVPLSLGALLAIVLAGPSAGALLWIVFCVSSSLMAMAQSAVGLAFTPALAGRALSAYNLVLFLGIFVVQWGMGLMIDAFQATGDAEPQAFVHAMAVFWLCSLASYVYFLKYKPQR